MIANTMQFRKGIFSHQTSIYLTVWIASMVKDVRRKSSSYRTF